jgi:hypothetical protein
VRKSLENARHRFCLAGPSLARLVFISLSTLSLFVGERATGPERHRGSVAARQMLTSAHGESLPLDKSEKEKAAAGAAARSFESLTLVAPATMAVTMMPPAVMMVVMVIVVMVIMCRDRCRRESAEQQT